MTDAQKIALLCGLHAARQLVDLMDIADDPELWLMAKELRDRLNQETRLNPVDSSVSS